MLSTFLLSTANLHPYIMVSTTCEDAALDDTVDALGVRAAPIHLSCMLGTQLGTATSTDYCPEANALTGFRGECYTAVHEVRRVEVLEQHVCVEPRVEPACFQMLKLD